MLDDAAPAAERQPPDPHELRVMIATTRGRGGHGGIDRLTDIIVDELRARPELAVSVATVTSRGARSLMVAPFYFAVALSRFIGAAMRKRVDLLHIHLATRGSVYRKLFFVFLARLFSVPYVIHLHGGEFEAYVDLTHAWLRALIGDAFIHCRGIVVLGEHWRQAILTRWPSVATKVVVLRNASLPSPGPQIGDQGNEVRVTFAGRVCAAKGVPQLLAALSELTEIEGWRAVIVGEGEVSQHQIIASRLKLTDRVHFTGWINARAMTAVLRHTDILALPSFAECLPMVVIEAFAHGIAVVATGVGSVPEILTDEVNGLIVPTGDVSALAAALRRLILSPELRRKLGAAALAKHSRELQADHYVVELVGLWRRFLATEEQRRAGGELEF